MAPGKPQGREGKTLELGIEQQAKVSQVKEGGEIAGTWGRATAATKLWYGNANGAPWALMSWFREMSPILLALQFLMWSVT